MPMARARKLCPKLIVLPGDYERHEDFSRWMFGYAHDFTPDVERTSIDVVASPDAREPVLQPFLFQDEPN